MSAPADGISGATRLAGIIGDPVAHSLSPALHNAAYRSLGLDWVYVAFGVPAGHAGEAVAAARTLGLVGLSVTMPHKGDVVASCDELGDDARRLRSVNTVSVVAGRVRGDTTDGDGFVRSLASAGIDVAGRTVLMLGAGGAARAVALACDRNGARVLVSARRAGAVAELVGLVPGVAPVPWEDRGVALAAADLLVNATPIGMGDSSEIPLDLAACETRHVVVDLVYHPLETALLAGARAHGAQVVDGLGMLVEQAALQVELWAGARPDVEAMRAAVLEARR